MAEFKYAPMFQLGPDTTEYYKIPGSEKLVKTSKFGDKTILEVSPEEALVYESDKVKKRPLLEKARELGSIRKAALSLTGHDKDKL